MEILPGPQPLVRPVFASVENQLDSMDAEECPEKESSPEAEMSDYDRKDYMEINFRDTDDSHSPASCDEGRVASANFRAELKRPDLKGTFRCSICSKVFCHSSSLSRHRMQAHFKSYKCTLCRKDITSNETLRAHMYKQHQISRMFMCRCCNWAFPDKTSLHMHIQAREEGKSSSVSVIGKGLSDSVTMDPSPFAPINTMNNNNNNIMNNNNNNSLVGNNAGLPHHLQPQVLPPPQSLPFFPATPTPLVPNQQDELGRLRERMVLNQLIAQQGFGLSWLNQLPKPIPTTRPLDLRPSVTEDELEINVDKATPKMEDDDKLNVSSSDSDEPKSEGSQDPKRIDSPLDNGSFSSTDGSSPSHTGSSPSHSAPSPINIFKKDPASPSAFHHLNVDSSRAFVSSSHVSPSDTISSGSPGSCFECAVYKTKLALADNKSRYLESRANTLQAEAVRAQSQCAGTETALRALEGETRALRDITEQLQRRLIECQEQSLRFVQSDRVQNPQAVVAFLNQLIHTTLVR